MQNGYWDTDHYSGLLLYTCRLESLLAIPTIDHNSGIGLLVIDSFAGLVRKEYDLRTTRGIVDRYYYLLDQSRTLKYVYIIGIIL